MQLHLEFKEQINPKIFIAAELDKTELDKITKNLIDRAKVLTRLFESQYMCHQASFVLEGGVI